MKVQMLCSEQSLKWAEHHSRVKAKKKKVSLWRIFYYIHIRSCVQHVYKKNPLKQHIFRLTTSQITIYRILELLDNLEVS